MARNYIPPKGAVTSAARSRQAPGGRLADLRRRSITVDGRRGSTTVNA
jgi:hypothetical protein